MSKSSVPFLVAAFVLGSSAVLLSGCAAVVVGGAGSAGVNASEERGLEGSVNDTKINAEISDLWLKKDGEMFRRLNLNIFEGRVMITGTADNEDVQADAVSLAWQAKGVREVLNDIEVGRNSAADYSRDLLISQTLGLDLLGDSKIHSINYKSDVVNGVVYIVGIAKNDDEENRVLNHARNISHVRRVVNHILLSDDPKRRAP